MQARYNGEVIGSTKSKLILNMLTFFSPGEHETKMDSMCTEKEICITKNNLSVLNGKYGAKRACRSDCDAVIYYNENVGKNVSVATNEYKINNSFKHGLSGYDNDTGVRTITTHKSVTPFVSAYEDLTLANFKLLYKDIINMDIGQAREFIKIKLYGERIQQEYRLSKEKTFVEMLEKFIPGGFEKYLSFPTCTIDCKNIRDSCTTKDHCIKKDHFYANKVAVDMDPETIAGGLNFRHGFVYGNTVNLPKEASVLGRFYNYTKKIKFMKIAKILIKLETLAAVGTFLALLNSKE